jgi:hypothetical protein
MTVADKVVSAAKGEVGYHESFSGGHWTNHEKYAAQVPGLAWVSTEGLAWCAVFAAWCALKGGAAALYPRSASCAVDVAWFKKIGRFSAYPAVGAQIFYGPGGGSHTGIVTGYDAEHVYTVEGNTNTNGSAEGDGVYARTRLRRDPYVYGYGLPKFPEGIVSADPAYAHDKPKPPVKPAPPKPKPSVSLAHILAASHRDPKLPQGGATYKAEGLVVEHALAAEGLLPAAYVDGSMGSKSKAAVAALQRRYGFSGTAADGYFGITSLTRLGAAHGFKVTK